MAKCKIDRIDPDTYMTMYDDIIDRLCDALPNTHAEERKRIMQTIYHLQCAREITKDLKEYYRTHRR